MHPINLADFEPLAKAVLDRAIYDYVAGGAEDEVTLAENSRAFERYALRPRVLVDVECCDLATEVLGASISFPVIIAPMALHQLCHPEGELATARAAENAGVIFTVGTLASYTIEEIRAVTSGPLWFQLYAYKDWGINQMLLDRAKAAGALAIVLTLDTAFLGRRERDLRNDFQLPDGIVEKHLAGVLEMASRAGQGYANLVPADELRERSWTWRDMERIRAATGLPLILKGIMTREDAALASQSGAVDAVIVSNHGGRQLDGSIASLDALAEVVEDVQGSSAPYGGEIQVILDGGVRRGSHIVKALALGARAIMIGRPILYALAAAGEAGVRRQLELLRHEFHTALALTGCVCPGQLDSSYVRRVS